MSKITKKEIVEDVARTTGLTKKAAAEAVDATIDSIAAALKGKKDVGLAGLGTLKLKYSKARQGVRPGTKELMDIPASTSVGFKVASTLKETLNR